MYQDVAHVKLPPACDHRIPSMVKPLLSFEIAVRFLLANITTTKQYSTPPSHMRMKVWADAAISCLTYLGPPLRGCGSSWVFSNGRLFTDKYTLLSLVIVAVVLVVVIALPVAMLAMGKLTHTHTHTHTYIILATPYMYI